MQTIRKRINGTSVEEKVKENYYETRIIQCANEEKHVNRRTV